MAMLLAIFLILDELSGAKLVLQRMGLSEMVRKSDVIVIGQVEIVVSRYGEGRAAGKIYTDYSIKVDEVLKGKVEPGGIVVVTVPGGEIGNSGQLVPGAPRLSKGDKVFAFLGQESKTGSGVRRRIVGFSQGIFRIYESLCGTERCFKMEPFTDGVILLGDDKEELQIVDKDLEWFVKRVKQILKDDKR